MKIIYFSGNEVLYSENDEPTEIPKDMLLDELDAIKIFNRTNNTNPKTLILPEHLPLNLKELELTNVGLISLPILPSTLVILDISYNPKLNPDDIILPDGLESFTCTNNKWTHVPALPRSLRFLDCQGNKLEKIPRIPYNCNLDIRLKGFKGLTDDEVKLKIYNDIVKHYGLGERTMATYPTEDEYYAVLDLDAGKEVARATDLGMIFLDLGLAPLVASEIAAWDRNRKTDLPTISAFDAAQLNGLMESLNTSRKGIISRRRRPWTKTQQLFKLSSKGQTTKKIQL
uniref:Leucine-rich repeat domain-containing protein n=1 Tax=viral metagenome TaxID=1070528 RepID=A0A6C0JR98_9ZZZZ